VIFDRRDRPGLEIGANRAKSVENGLNGLSLYFQSPLADFGWLAPISNPGRDRTRARRLSLLLKHPLKGNRYRLIVSIDYESQLIYIKYVLTHAEYDKENWKDDPYF
jgi:HigB_toxin, RelE-like toxic component of a toxin-antitoxin system